jgi:hypothetical protein
MDPDPEVEVTKTFFSWLVTKVDLSQILDFVVYHIRLAYGFLSHS